MAEASKKKDKIEEFIGFLVDRPALWRKQDRDFSNRDVREKDLLEIAEAITESGNGSGYAESPNKYYGSLMPEFGKVAPSVDWCRKKLKYLKDRMREIVSDLLKTKSGQPAFETGKVTWKYYQAMLFMKDQFVGRTMNGTLHSPTREGNEDSHHQPLPQDGDDYDKEHDSVDNLENHSLSGPSPSPSSSAASSIAAGAKRCTSRNKRARMEEQFLNIEREKVENIKKFMEPQQPKDEWDMFASSLACDLRKIKDPYTALKLKGEINKLMNETVLQSMQPPPPFPYDMYGNTNIMQL